MDERHDIPHIIHIGFSPRQRHTDHFHPSVINIMEGHIARIRTDIRSNGTVDIRKSAGDGYRDSAIWYKHRPYSQFLIFSCTLLEYSNLLISNHFIQRAICHGLPHHSLRRPVWHWDVPAVIDNQSVDVRYIIERRERPLL